MSYVIQAVISSISDLTESISDGTVIIALPQGMGLIPFTEVFRERFDIPFLPLTDGQKELLPAVEDYIISLKSKTIAYIEAEFFGGVGDQAAVVWKAGRLIYGPICERSAINRALQFLLVVKGNHHDEFDALNLGRFRNIDDWKQ